MSPLASSPDLLFDFPGEVAARCRAMNWEDTPLGPPQHWPAALRSGARMILNSRMPMTLAWGPELVQIYNEGYLPILQEKHPEALGQPVRRVYSEIWEEVRPLLEGVYRSGEALWLENHPFELRRKGRLEQCHFTFSYSPFRDEHGEVVGILASAVETTASVRAIRRARQLGRLGTFTEATSVEAVLSGGARCLEEAFEDLPRVLLFEVDAARDHLRLIETTEPRMGPRPLFDQIPWRSTREGLHLVELPGARQAGAGPWVWLPIVELHAGGPRVVAGMLASLHPHLPLDEDYRTFLQEVGATLARNIQRVRYLELTRANAQRRYEAVFRNSLDAMMLTTPQGEILEANPAAEALLGYSADELCEIGRRGIIDPDAPGLHAALVQVQRTGTYRGELCYRHREGTLIPCDVSCATFQDARGNLRASVTIRDLRARQDLESRLRHAQKMEAVGKLAGGVAHDFNNLLTVIQNSTQVLEEQLADPMASTQSLQAITEACARASALTERLLAFSRRQPMQKTALDLPTLIEALTPIMRPLIGNDVIFSRHLGPTCWPILADRQRIEQVLLNLLVNARDAMPEGGELTLKASNHVERRRRIDALGQALRPGRYVHLRFSDTGQGLSDQTLARLFEPYFTTKKEGTGLGMVTVAEVIRESEGAIFVESAPGQGCTFDLYFPAAEERATPSSDGPGAIRGRRSLLPWRVLLVDAQTTVRLATERLLILAGLEVTGVESAARALELVERPDLSPFDLLITEGPPPELPTAELIQRLKARAPGLRVLLVDASTSPDDAAELATQRDAPLLQKPYGYDELIAAILQVMNSSASD
ncbi:hypothetical protein DL240_09005 [Lujinxingia litoralis]|uniref:histidine kinase n=1 Tax=Lujinxingia litoralis TaxID=2211119 RepID=A0A328C6X6_9DELT|nr:ATP-binding protein [Lujinxingia litoralis]RAL23016.1 hypothetical protein DL240_09005 [Lujinxingia litoralis]